MDLEISLNHLRFYAYHGVLPEETKNGNEFEVNLSVSMPYDEKMAADDPENILSYVSLYEIVESRMNIPVKLLETVVSGIVNDIRERFPEVTKGRVSIEKKHPPIPGMLGSASVALNF